MNQNIRLKSKKGMAKLLIVLIAAILILIAAVSILSWWRDKTLYRQVGIFNFDNYEWDTVSAAQKEYENADWHNVTVSRWAGFSPQGNFSEKEKEIDYSGEVVENIPNHLRYEGCGRISRVFWLEENGQKIDDWVKVRDQFSPVESEAEAMSFVAALENDLKIDSEKDILIARTATVAGHFVVQAIELNNCICGDRRATSIVYEVFPSSGSIMVIGRDPKHTINGMECVY